MESTAAKCSDSQRTGPSMTYSWVCNPLVHRPKSPEHQLSTATIGRRLLNSASWKPSLTWLFTNRNVIDFILSSLTRNRPYQSRIYNGLQYQNLSGWNLNSWERQKLPPATCTIRNNIKLPIKSISNQTRTILNIQKTEKICTESVTLCST